MLIFNIDVTRGGDDDSRGVKIIKIGRKMTIDIRIDIFYQFFFFPFLLELIPEKCVSRIYQHFVHFASR